MNMNISPEPYWLLEAMACMNYVHTLDSEEWLNKNSSWTRRQKEEFLAPYRSYRGAMRARLQPVLGRYPMLEGYVDSARRERESLRSFDPPMISFLTQMQEILEAEEQPGEEELEKALNRAFGKMLGSDLQKSPETEEIVICGLADVMAALEGWDGEDADKFKLLRLYSERREVMEQLWSLKEPCREIGLECLELVRERFAACMEDVRNQEKLAALLDGVGLQWEEECEVWISPAIMQYDGIMVQASYENQTMETMKLKVHLGIETFYLFVEKKEDCYNDNCLLSGLKALGDPTRLKILRLLVERPCYLQEMARTLGVTPATVLHHLGVLIGEDLIEIQMTKEKKKVYYQVKKQGFQKICEGITQLTLTNHEREEKQHERRIQEGRQKQGGWQWTM